MQQQSTKKTVRKNIYLILTAVGIVVVAIAIAIALSQRGGDATLDVGKSVSVSVSNSNINSQSKTDSDGKTSSSQSNTKSDVTNPPEQKAQYIFPIANGTIMTEYTQAGLVYNQTMGRFEGHMGWDVTGDKGAKVLCVSDGTIESVSEAYLEGTTIVVDHGNGVKSLYNSIELADDIVVGKTVKMGDELGVISTNNLQEYKDGPHLHFEMLENGKQANPFDFIEGDAK